MLISKFDLYKSEWLELVFDDRNKAYGAYELRQHYGRTMVKAMGITFLSIAVTAFVIGLIIKPVVTHEAQQRMIPVPLMNYVHPPVLTPPKPIVHTHAAAAKPLAPVKQQVFIPLLVTEKPVTTEPPKIIDLKGNIGPTEVKIPGDNTKGITDKPAGPGGPGTSAPSNGNEPVTTDGLERLPQPMGGVAGWSKFLQKHLIYPDQAIQQKAEGKVWVSFIVEKDGHLSNIIVDRGAGYGMDEEAIRVLKLAPAWKPGIQNGQPVRVKFNIPINFLLGDDNN